jgi:hypothetical protein
MNIERQLLNFHCNELERLGEIGVEVPPDE